MVSFDNTIHLCSEINLAAPAAPEYMSSVAASTSGFNDELTAASTFKSISEFRKKAPELYDTMMKSLVQHILDESRHRTKHLKDAMRKIREAYS
jgi:hypothetical protein